MTTAAVVMRSPAAPVLIPVDDNPALILCDPFTLDTCANPECGDTVHRAVGRQWRACEHGHRVRVDHGLCSRCSSRRKNARRKLSDSAVAAAKIVAPHTPRPPHDHPETPPYRGPVWWEDAACRGTDRRLFFAQVRWTTRDVTRLVGPTAARYCAGCPIRAACGSMAEATRSVGLFGGIWRRIQPQSGAYERMDPTCGCVVDDRGQPADDMDVAASG